MCAIRKLRIITGAAAALLLSGCASMGLGESNYSCKGYPDGVGCLSAREAYEMSHEDLESIEETVAERNAAAAAGEEYKPTQAARAVRTIRPDQQPMPVPHLEDGSVPIRTPAHTMRIWVAPWEDERQNLQVTGRVYTEIEPRKWVIGLPTKDATPKLRLLQEIPKTGDPRKKEGGDSPSQNKSRSNEPTTKSQ